MKIAINCWVLRNKQLDGIGYFTINSFQRIIRNHPEVTFVLLCDKNFNEPYFTGANVEIKKIFPPYRHPILYVFYLEFILPFYLRKIKPDLFVSAEGFLSLMSKYKQLPVIYDLNFEHFPENLALKNRMYYRFFFKRFARKAARIATISEYSKKDIIQLYKVKENNIDNVSCGINSNFYKLSEDEKLAARNKYAQGKPYFFFIGSIHPRKNVQRLLVAFNQFKTKTGSEFKLIIGGVMRWSKSALLDAYESSEYKDDIIFPGRLSDDELKHALGGAYALTFVPVFEGFGLPIVEAFAAEVPVMTSNATSLPEVAGDAAIYVDPFDTDSICRGMETLYHNPHNICNDLVEKGKIQKNTFSWDRTAGLLWESILKAVK
jgi:glycosyltransferase involved in cell wall biosynthesis